MSSVMTSVYKNMEKNGPSVLFVPKNNTKSTKYLLRDSVGMLLLGKCKGGPPVSLISFMQCV